MERMLGLQVAVLCVFAVWLCGATSDIFEFPVFPNSGAPPISVGTWYFNRNVATGYQDTPLLSKCVLPGSRW